MLNRVIYSRTLLASKGSFLYFHSITSIATGAAPCLLGSRVFACHAYGVPRLLVVEGTMKEPVPKTTSFEQQTIFHIYTEPDMKRYARLLAVVQRIITFSVDAEMSTHAISQNYWRVAILVCGTSLKHQLQL